MRIKRKFLNWIADMAPGVKEQRFMRSSLPRGKRSQKEILDWFRGWQLVNTLRAACRDAGRSHKELSRSSAGVISAEFDIPGRVHVAL
jgi:hypothetical protein